MDRIMENTETQNRITPNDFYKVPNIKFDITKLRNDLEKILKKKNFNTLGIKCFGAISLNHLILRYMIVWSLDRQSNKLIF